MKTPVPLFVFTTTCLFLFTLLSCGLDTDDEDVVEPGPVEFKAARPASGSILRPGESIIVYFSAPPENLTVEPGTVSGSGIRVTITGAFSLGSLTVELTWTDGTQTLEYTVIPKGMILIREGNFQRGSDSEMASDDEQPIHNVFVDSFFIDEHEVTVGEYKSFVETTGHQEPDWQEILPYAPTDQHPIVYVSWHDAMAYAMWVGKRLPTEAEWEKAARGGLIAKTYPWGNISPQDSRCNFADKNLTLYWWSDKNADDGYAFTAPVGSYPENDYGLFDMAGNVLEWCLDRYNPDFYTISQEDNPFSGTNTVHEISKNFESVQSNRVLRGGSWIVTANNVRNSTRFFLPPESKSNTVGFRCAVGLQ